MPYIPEQEDALYFSPSFKEKKNKVNKILSQSSNLIRVKNDENIKRQSGIQRNI